MKIWILTSETPHFWAGGIARYVDNFARVAGKKGHEVLVISRGPEDSLEEVSPGYTQFQFVDRFKGSRVPRPDIEPDENPGWPFNNMAYFPALSYRYADEVEALFAKFGEPDVIECQDYGAIGYFLLQRKLTRPGFLTNVPVVVHMHTPDFVVQGINQYPRHKLPDYWMGRMERACLHMADALLSPSHFIARELREWVEGELPETETIPYPWPFSGRREWGSAGEEFRLLYVGRIELRKGVEPLLAACERLWAEGMHFHLDLVGGDVHTPLKGGSLLAYLAGKYRHRIAEGKLSFLGKLPHESVLKFHDRASAVIIPSLWENFPNTCIEAMGCGKLVLGSRCGGQAEMVGDDDRAGMVFDPNDPESVRSTIWRALKLPANERAQIGENAIERIHRLCDPHLIVEKRLLHFESVIARHGKKDRFPFNNERLREGKLAKPLSGNPLVTAVIPFYNLGKFIEECVDSIMTSEGVRFEVLIVNDGSHEVESLQALERIRARGYDNLRVLNIRNGGLANARNVGAQNARGELVAFVDADDCVEPKFFARAVEVFKQYRNVHVVSSWVRFFGEGRGVWHSWNWDVPYLLCHNLMIPICMVRRESFLEFGQNKPHIIYGLEDFEGWISMVEAGCGGVAIPEVLARYRIRGDSMFKVIENDKKLYLYDLIANEHPELYDAYGKELFLLLNANGPAHGWDQPTMFRAPYDRITGRLHRAQMRLNELEAEYKRVKEAEAWHIKERERLLGEARKG